MVTQYGAFSGIVYACLKYAGHPEAAETVGIHTGLDVPHKYPWSDSTAWRPPGMFYVSLCSSLSRLASIF
jgi:hypothetical protein